RKMYALPDFIVEHETFMEGFYKAHPRSDLFSTITSDSPHPPEAGLAWHVRAWGHWVLDRARRDLAGFYPTYADFEPLNPGKVYKREPMRLVPVDNEGKPDTDVLNAEFTQEYLADKRNPRWVAKPTVAYLWARTVICKNCRAMVPLLKTRWLCK